MKRRTLLTQAALWALSASAAGPARAASEAPNDELAPIWSAWKQAHLDRTGRVVDVGQERASHSEGQGYGMALAVEFDDRVVFDAMHRWTQANLAVRPDALLAWRWRPDIPKRIDDFNNASDGDLFYAWALLRAAEHWNEPAYLNLAKALARDLVANCVIERPDMPDDVVILPAAFGFTKPGSVILNPSYMMPRALREVGRATGETARSDAAEGGLRLMADLARVGSMPDWVRSSSDGLSQAEGFSDHTGYEAIRVPLFLIWSGETNHPAVRAHAMGAEQMGNGAPIVFSRVTGEIYERSPDTGYEAVHALTRCVTGDMGFSTMPYFDPKQPYYPATLQLFSMLAVTRTLQTCTPI